MRIPLSKPSITDSEINAVVEVMKSGHIAAGRVVEEFEAAFAKYCRTRYAIAVSSGTAGLFLSLKAMKVGRGHEIITTPFSFVATTNVIYQAGAVPFFVDIRRDTYNLDVHSLIRNIGLKNVGGILPVDVFGVPFDTSRVKGIPIILDSCESLGTDMDRPFDTAVYAFYPNKQITAGEGGMIVTNNASVRDYCVAMRNQGRKKGDNWLTSSYMGFNYRMTDIQAAIGLEQLRRINEIVGKRRAVVQTYLKYLRDFELHGAYRLQKGIEDLTISPFVFTVEVENRDRIMLYMLKEGIEVKPYFPCIHLQPYMRQRGYKPGMYPVAEEVSSLTMALPFYTDMTEEEVFEVVKTLGRALTDG
jgi:perosamine synthetase